MSLIKTIIRTYSEILFNEFALSVQFCSFQEGQLIISSECANFNCILAKGKIIVTMANGEEQIFHNAIGVVKLESNILDICAFPITQDEEKFSNQMSKII